MIRRPVCSAPAGEEPGDAGVQQHGVRSEQRTRQHDGGHDGFAGLHPVDADPRGQLRRFPLVAAAAEKVGSSTDPKKLAEALETTEVQENAKTAFLSRYNFSSDNHGPNPDTSELKFISPTKILNGQFGNPAAS